ncbi:MAG: hypothetical protein DRJ42_14895 [Deltaproteobacteria bacterium]|nr:MAG: hypothetical protein DRJ42_14895 [Deltaproteobacteria bacterium]
MGHFAHTACSEEDLTTWLGWAQQDEMSFYDFAPGDPFSCVDDLSLCTSCPEDIATCERGYVFEFAVDGAGRRYLYGVIAAPARSEGLWDLTPTTLDAAHRARVNLGSMTETGEKCELRQRLLAGEVASLWVEHVPRVGARSVRHLEGEDAAAFGRDLGASFGLGAYCDGSHCVASGDGEAFGVYYTRGRRRRRRARRPPRITVVTHGPPECEGCAPEPSPEVLARGSRRRRR